MGMTTIFDFPDINQEFVGSRNVNTVCLKYIDTLRLTNISYNIKYSDALLRFLDVEKYIEYIEHEYYAFKAFIRRWSKANNVKVKLKMRKKSFIGFNEKIRLYLASGKDPLSIGDLIGFRLILCTGKVDTIETHRLCYKLMNDVLRYFYIERNYELLTADNSSKKNITLSADVLSKIFISDINEVLNEYINVVENYVLYPKEDGYQGLHACVRGILPFEIQIKSFAMDSYAEQIHSTYKDDRYKDSKIFLNLNNIDIDGLDFDENGKILLDYSGLFKGVDLLNLL